MTVKVKASGMRRLKQIAALYSATLISIVLGVAVSKLNTKLLDPAGYGDLKYVNNIFAIFTTVLTFGLIPTVQTLIPKLKDPTDKRRFFGASILALLSTGALITLGLIAFSFVQPLIFEKNLSSTFLFTSILAVGLVTERFMQAVLTGDNKIRMLSVFKLAPKVLNIAFLLLFNLVLVVNVNTAWISRLLALILSSGVIYFYALRPRFDSLRDNFVKILQNVRSYGLHVYTGLMFGLLSAQLTPVFISLFTGDNTNVGFYSLATMTTMPLSLAPPIVGQVFFKDFARSRAINFKALLLTVGLSMTTMVAFILLIKPLMLLIFGEDYAVAAELARVLVVGRIILGFGDLIAPFLAAHQRGKDKRNAAILSGSVAMVGNVFAVKIWGLHGAVITLISGALVYFLYSVFAYLRLIGELHRLPHPPGSGE